MNTGRLIQMAIRMVMRTVMRRGIGAGIDYATRRGGKTESSPEDKAQANQAGKLGKKARKSIRMARRIGRM